ncbi:MAG: M23 family metallopeptidase, partial [Clostridia bacterium]|nr:M23 family metallopeptidase [Clostridia bacterium]
IYMSNSASTVKVLLGAENFSEFLQLSQLTSSVSSRDKAMMEELAEAIKTLNEKNEENQKLLNDQVAVRSTILAKQAELENDENEAASIYNGIASEQKQSESEKAAIESNIRAMQKKLEDDIRARSYASFINPNTGFMWPVDGFRGISAGFQSNDPLHKGHHNGIDIAGGGIAGQPIRAIADGYVTLVSNSCTHNSKKSGNCCGNGYGNYCVVNHGNISGANYVAYYAHAERIIVGNGAHVTRGQILGYVGTTGWSTGYHLHLGIMRNNVWVNPYPLFF